MGSLSGVDQVGVDSQPTDSMPPPTSAGWTDGESGDGGGVTVPTAAAAPDPYRQGQVRTPFLLVALVVAIAAVAVLLVGIPGGGGGGGPLSPIARAAERTATATGARFAGTASGSVSGMSMQMRFDGSFSGTEDRSQIDMQIQATGPAPISTTMTGIQDGSTIYMSSPLFSGALPDGARWMKLDFSEFDGDASALEQGAALDARQMLESLRATSSGVRMVGTDRVRGVKTKHYTGTIDPARQAEQLREMGDEAGADLIAENVAPSTVEVWIDRNGYVRRFDMQFPLTIPGQGSASLGMSIQMFDFGATQSIAVPSDDDTFDATELSRQALEAGGLGG
jgi:hypothetical protein